MKGKILFAILFMSLMTMAFVSAQDQDRIRLGTHTEIREMIQENERLQTELRNSTIDGLERARLVVQNEVAAERIDDIMRKIQARNKLMIQNMEQLRFAEGMNNTVIVEGQGEAKLFSFIKMNREIIFVIDNEGNFERVGRPFDFLFKYGDDVEKVDVITE